MQKKGEKLSTAALWLGLSGIPLWLLSYVWIPFRFARLESETVWAAVVAFELGAMAAGLLSIAAGLTALWLLERGSFSFRRAAKGTVLGIAILVCIVLFNLIGIFFFS